MPRRMLVFLVGAALALSACGSSSSSSSASSNPTTTVAASAFPVTIKTANGDVIIPSRPANIISLAPTPTEMLYAVGAGDQVKAVDDQSNYPPDAPRTKLSGLQPNIEAIAARSPDLVVTSESSLAPQLAKVKVTTLVLPAANTLDDTYKELMDLGAATGHQQEAAAAVAKMKQDVEGITAKVSPSAKPLTYYYELDNTYYSATSKTFIGELMAKAGLKNIADAADKDGSGYPQLSPEYILQQNPDIVFLADTKCCQQSAQTVAARPGWDKLAAVKNGNVVALDDDIASRWGPRAVDLLRDVVNAANRARNGG